MKKKRMPLSEDAISGGPAKVDIVAVEKSMRVKERRLANLPEAFGLWLYWRDITNKRVPNRVAGSLREGVTLGMVNNFFTDYYGIGKGNFKSFKALYDHIKSRTKTLKNKDSSKPGKYLSTNKKLYPNQHDCPPLNEIEAMIQKCENEFYDKVNNRQNKRKSSRRSR